MRFITININFPALDNLVNFLTSIQQSQIDDATKTVRDLTDELKSSEASLDTSIEKEKQ